MDSNNFIKVPTKKIDDYNFQNLSYIKMDVQFHELEVLEGATKTLKIIHQFCVLNMLVEIIMN